MPNSKKLPGSGTGATNVLSSAVAGRRSEKCGILPISEGKLTVEENAAKNSSLVSNLSVRVTGLSRLKLKDMRAVDTGKVPLAVDTPAKPH